MATTRRPTSALVATILCIWAHTAHATNEEGTKFLSANSKLDGVHTLPSGLQYKVLRHGHGEVSPEPSTPCTCPYEGRTAQEFQRDPTGKTTFDSSYERGEPIDFAPNQVIKGWTEAMALMTVGDKWQLYIPSELAYGEQGSPPKIGGGDALVFTMEILKINGPTVPAPTRCDVKTLENCDSREMDFIKKMKEKSADAVPKEIERLKAMLGEGKIGDKPRSWIARRVNILRQLKQELRA